MHLVSKLLQVMQKNVGVLQRFVGLIRSICVARLWQVEGGWAWDLAALPLEKVFQKCQINIE